MSLIISSYGKTKIADLKEAYFRIEAIDRTMQMLDIYNDVFENLLAIPTIRGEKTESEKFAGAEATYTIETMMYDGKALQSATSHYFGQNFSKPFDIKFQNRDGKEEFAYQTSWGASTRMLGSVIMSHGDDRGLKLPPKIAPIQVIIVPIAQQKEGVLDKANELFTSLKDSFRVKIDDRDNYSTGYKFNDWEMRGIPIRLEIGPKDIDNNQCVLVRRDTSEKIITPLDDLKNSIEKLLNDIHTNMYNTCKKRLEERTTVAHTLEELEKQINTKQGFIKAMWCGDTECEKKIKDLTAVKSRCMPFEQEHLDDKCVVCGKEAKHMVIWGRQY